MRLRRKDKGERIKAQVDVRINVKTGSGSELCALSSGQKGRKLKNPDFKKYLHHFLFILLLALQTPAIAQDRFPRPEFETGYEYPEYQTPQHRSAALEYLDVFVLIAALGVTTWLALKKRSRRGLIWMSVFSLAYFGFYRLGCICAVGSVQNVSLAFFNPGYAIPLTALLFFIIPLLFALLFGRVFCAGVCPLGAIQELTGIKPLKIPRAAEVFLASIPFIYLALAILLSATNSQFIICRYDPFIGIFRLDGPYTMITFGALLLVAGVFVNRPYCRFLCPYGVLLNVFSRFAGRHLTITPAECTNCRLCEGSCPYGAIIPSDVAREPEPADLTRKRFILSVVLIPVFVIAGGLLFRNLAPVLAGANHDVRLAREIRAEKESGVAALSKAAIGFKESGKTEQELFTGETAILGNFQSGSPWVGVFLGASLGIGLLSLTIRKTRNEYKPDQGKCFSCGRCFKYCPIKVKAT
jgi:NosR/NirI family transcriptional regulator, nitrous oxide reductase regulator